MYGSVGESLALRLIRLLLLFVRFCLFFHVLCLSMFMLVLLLLLLFLLLCGGRFTFPGAGSGKTMLMDMFYDSVGVAKKKRVHFNGFMLDIHQRK